MSAGETGGGPTQAQGGTLDACHPQEAVSEGGLFRGCGRTYLQAPPPVLTRPGPVLQSQGRERVRSRSPQALTDQPWRGPRALCFLGT